MRADRHRDFAAGLDCLSFGNGTQWVEWRPCGVFCPEDGDFEDPHNTVAEAIADSYSGGVVIIVNGASTDADGDESFPLTINKRVTLQSFNGPVTLKK